MARPATRVSAIITKINRTLDLHTYWGESRCDFRTSRGKGKLGENDFLKRDSHLRRTARLKPPDDRIVIARNLEEVFTSLVDGALAEIQTLHHSKASIEAMEIPGKSVAFYFSLYNDFKALKNPRVVFVESPTNSYISLFLVGETRLETVIASTLLKPVRTKKYSLPLRELTLEPSMA